MRILIVDDNAEKSLSVSKVIEDAFASEPKPVLVVERSLSEAVRASIQTRFDLIVLDLLLPYVSDGPTDSRAGLELLRQLRSDRSPNRTTTIIGLSAYPDEVTSSRAKFDEWGLVVVSFDTDGAWSRTLTNVVKKVNASTLGSVGLDFVIICALEEERAGFSHTGLRKIKEAIVGGLNVNFVATKDGGEARGAIIRLSQMGLVAATRETTTALAQFNAPIVCMSGICAGIGSHAELGQVVVANPSWEYQAGKWSRNDFEIAPYQIPLPAETRSVIDRTISRDDFTRNLEATVPASVFRPPRLSKPALVPFASGSAVIADAKRLNHIQVQHRKVAAIDMETFGLYYAAHECASRVTHYFSTKCVVDNATANKNDDIHEYGCIASARATEAIIVALMERRAPGSL